MELKEKEATSYSFGTQFEPSDEPVKRPLDDNEGIVIVETALTAEKPAEEEGIKEICGICLSYCRIIFIEDASLSTSPFYNSNALRLQ